MIGTKLQDDSRITNYVTYNVGCMQKKSVNFNNSEMVCFLYQCFDKRGLGKKKPQYWLGLFINLF